MYHPNQIYAGLRAGPNVMNQVPVSSQHHASYSNCPSFPTNTPISKRQLEFGEENKENQQPPPKKNKPDVVTEDLSAASEGEGSESESSYTSSSESPVPPTSNTQAQSTPTGNPNMFTHQNWCPPVSQLQMPPNYLEFGGNPYYNNQAVLNHQQMLAFANSNPLTHFTPTPTAYPQNMSQSFLPSGSSSHFTDQQRNFVNLTSSFDLTTNTPDSGCVDASGSNSDERKPDINIKTDPSGTDPNNALMMTPFNPLYRQPSSMPFFDPNQVYCTVPGRCALLSNVKKYKVSLGEIYRRISLPECLNASHLGGILRKAKKENGGNELRTNLKRHGMSLPSGRRKSHPCTTFTSLCEEEAKQMGKDFFTLCNEFFPTSALALPSASIVGNSIEETNQKLAAVQWAGQMIEDLIRLVDGYEASSYAAPQAGDNYEDDAARKGIVNFSRLTHGFGNIALITSWQAFQQYLKIVAVELAKNSSVSH